MQSIIFSSFRIEIKTTLPNENEPAKAKTHSTNKQTHAVYEKNRYDVPSSQSAVRIRSICAPLGRLKMHTEYTDCMFMTIFNLDCSRKRERKFSYANANAPNEYSEI